MYRQDRLCGFEATHYTIDGLKQIGVQKRKEEFGDLCLKGRKRKKRVIVTQWTLELPQRLHKRRSVRRSILKGREMGHTGTSSKAAQKKKRSDIYLEKTRKGSSSLKRTFELLQRLHIQKREGSMIYLQRKRTGSPSFWRTLELLQRLQSKLLRDGLELIQSFPSASILSEVSWISCIYEQEK